ncbi:MAG: hypothetical protein RLZ98_978 [Pseudomonadota bacterium]
MDSADRDIAEHEFFISRAGRHPADVAMARHVGQILEADGHPTFLQDWDMANRNFVERMNAALASGSRVIAILTPEYLASKDCEAEWLHALGDNRLNTGGRLIVLRAADVMPEGLLRTIAFWDLTKVAGNDAALAEMVRYATLPDAHRRSLPVGYQHWRQSLPLLHDKIRPTQSFTGRESQLLRIDNVLWGARHEAAAITQPAAVTGLGGIGKSTLAREYGWRAQEGYAGVWWLDASSDAGQLTWDKVQAGLVELGATWLPSLARMDDRAAAARHALDILAHGGFARPWLLVFDNVDDPRVLDVWAPNAANVHVLVTSRLGNWRAGVTEVECDTWSMSDCADYLRRETGRTFTDADCTALADELGRLPLALSHAAAYLRRRAAVTVADYIEDLESHMRGLPKDAEYRSPVFATYRAALAEAEAEAPGVAALMSLAAFFAPDDIPELLFCQDAFFYPPELVALVSRRAKLRDGLGVLDDLSLITFKEAERTFSTHRLVQAAARDALGDAREDWARRAVAVLQEAFPAPAPDTWPTCVALARHAAAHAPAEAGTFQLALTVGQAGQDMASHVSLADALDHHAAANALLAGLTAAKPENLDWQRDLSVSHNEIGDVLRAQGNLPAALDAFKASLAIRQRLAAADPGNAGWQRDLSVSHNKIGDVLAAQGNLPAALDAYKAALAIAERLAAADPGNAGWQRDLYVSLFRITNMEEAQGNLTGALNAIRQAHGIMEKLTKQDPGNAGWQRDLSYSHNKIGDVLAAQGNLAAALDAYKASHAIFERLAAADPGNAGWQRDLSYSNYVIGQLLLKEAKPREALPFFEASLAIDETLAGRDPSNVMWQDDVAKSRRMVEQVRAAAGR